MRRSPGSFSLAGFTTVKREGIELTGSFVAPAHLTDTASVTVPFTATGLLSRDYPLPTLQLSGGGAVTFTLQWQSAINGWAIRFTSFDFGGGQATKG